MRKFYYKFQWVGAFLAPLVMIFGPIIFGIQTQWMNPLIPIALGLSIFGLLLTIAILTTRQARNRNKHKLPTRIALFLEGSYTAILAILLTSGSHEAHSTPPVVSVLQARGIAWNDAWEINNFVRVALFIVVFLFLITALVSAIARKVEINHRQIEVIPREEFFSEDDSAPNNN